MTDRTKEAREAIEQAKAQIEESRDTLRSERNRLKAEAEKYLKQAQDLTDDIGDDMDWDVAYGMGGYYKANHGWVSSSADC